MTMIISQSLNVLGQSQDTGRGEDTGLTHPAAECLADSSRLRDGLGVSHEHGSERSSEAL